jgi:hypothetical protein
MEEGITIKSYQQTMSVSVVRQDVVIRQENNQPESNLKQSVASDGVNHKTNGKKNPSKGSDTEEDETNSILLLETVGHESVSSSNAKKRAHGQEEQQEEAWISKKTRIADATNGGYSTEEESVSEDVGDVGSEGDLDSFRVR